MIVQTFDSGSARLLHRVPLTPPSTDKAAQPTAMFLSDYLRCFVVGWSSGRIELLSREGVCVIRAIRIHFTGFRPR